MPVGDTNLCKTHTPIWTRGFTLGTFANFTASCNYFMLMVVMTDYALVHYEVPASLAGLTASIFIIGTIFARSASAVAIESVPKKKLMYISAVASILLSASYLLTLPIWGLLVVRFCHGFTFGMLSTTIATYITQIVPSSRKGEGIGYYMLSATLGAAIGPFVGVLISRYLGFHLLFIVATIIVAFSIPLIAFMKCIDCECDENQKSTKSPETVDKLPDGEVDVVENSATDKKHTTKQKAHVIAREAVPIGIVCCLIFFGYSAILTFLTPYAAQAGFTGAASVYFIVYATSMFFTRPISGRIFDRRGPRIVMIPAFFAFIVGMVCLGIATNDWLVLISALLCGYGVGTLQSCGLAMAVSKVSVSKLAAANATFYILIDSGVGAGPVILGALVPYVGYSSMFYAMAVMGAIALCLFLLVTSKLFLKKSNSS